MKAAKYIFVLGIVLCATVVSNFTQDQSLAIRYAILAAVTLSLFFLLKVEVPCGWIVPCFAGYLGFATLSLLWAPNPIGGLNEVSKIFVLLVLFCVACRILERDKDIFIKGMTILALLLGSFCFGERLFLADNQCNGTMYVRNVWASAQLLLLPFCVCSIRKWWFTGVFASSLIVLNMVLLLNRASLLAMFVMAMVFVFFNKKSLRYYIIAGVLIVFVVCLFNPHFLNTESLKSRYAVWTATAKLFRENPYFGIGINNWATEVPRYASIFLEPEAFSKTFYIRPHNDPMWVLSEVGIFGFICYAGIFVFGLYYAVRSRNIRATAFLLGYMVIASFSFPKEKAYHSMLLIAGLADAVTGCRFRKLQIPILARIAILITLCFIAAQFTICHASERHMRKMQMARETKRWAEVLAQAEQVSWLRPMDSVTLPVKWYTGEAHYYLGNHEQAVIDNAESLKCNPNNVYVLDRVGGMFIGLGNLDAAEACYRRALRIQPNFKHSADNLEKVLGMKL